MYELCVAEQEIVVGGAAIKGFEEYGQKENDDSDITWKLDDCLGKDGIQDPIPLVMNVQDRRRHRRVGT